MAPARKGSREVCKSFQTAIAFEDRWLYSMGQLGLGGSRVGRWGVGVFDADRLEGAFE